VQNGGTLFLDEIGEMPLDMQAKLLRVLETRTFCRLGGSKKVKINVRVLAAHLPYEIAGHIESNGTDQADPWEQWLHLRPLGQMSLAEVTERVGQYFVRWALETTQHNRARATELLGLAKVDQLRYLMRKYGLNA